MPLANSNMTANFRMRLTAWFVFLSSVVYILLTGIGYGAFERNLAASIDYELKLLASEFGHAVDLVGNKPRFRDWARTLETEPARGLATIQLFDREGKLLEKFGPRGVNRLLKKTGIASDQSGQYRVLYTPLTKGGETLGYLQFQISTASSDNSLKQLFLVLILVGPAIIVGLGVSSYYVAGLAAKPLEDNLEAMRRFIADAGHELNTPLSVARAKVETIERRLSPQDELSSVMRALASMERIVDDLMYLTEVDTPIAANRFVQCDLTSLIADLVDDFELRYEAKEINLVSKVDSDLSIACEPELIYRALGNLVENALRYTDAGGKVSIEAVSRGGIVVVTVSDTGIGIPLASQSQIFDRFYRVDKSRSRQSGGVGLGLSIVRAIAEKHGGSIAVSSHEGQGAVFKLSLPRG